MGVRERLDALTTKLWASVDAVLADESEAESIDASTVAVDAAIIEVTALADSTAITDLNTQIAAITAIPTAQRTQAQKDMLVLLRIVKAQQAALLPLYREALDSRRRIRTLQRNHSIIARFAMMLDGGTKRVRQTDVDGDE
jgi:hypothetical protein